MEPVPFQKYQLNAPQWGRPAHPHLALIPTQEIFEMEALKFLNLPRFDEIEVEFFQEYGHGRSYTGFMMPSRTRERWWVLEDQLLKISNALGDSVFKDHNLDFRFDPYPVPSKTGIFRPAWSEEQARKRVIAAVRSMMLLIAWTSLGVILVNSVHRRGHIDNFIPGYWEEKLLNAGFRKDVVEHLAASPIGSFTIPRVGMIVDPLDCPYTSLVQVFIRLKIPIWCHVGRVGDQVYMGLV